jgi:hypothetical protein
MPTNFRIRKKGNKKTERKIGKIDRKKTKRQTDRKINRKKSKKRERKIKTKINVPLYRGTLPAGTEPGVSCSVIF